MLALIQEVNELFEPFYPYVARQIATVYNRQNGTVLEIGPYAPGISTHLARLCPQLKIVVGDDTPGILDYFQDEIEKAGLTDRIEVKEISKTNLPFPRANFDLVYFRGALFFWEKQVDIVREAYRVLKRGGVAVLGGGFGADAPADLIDSRLAQSRQLNRRLGKKVLSEAELEAILEKAGLSQHRRIDKRHGLWVILGKP